MECYTHKIAEQIFQIKFCRKVKFIKIIPEVKLHPNVYVDVYAEVIINSKTIKLCIEYNGYQHYVFPNHFHMKAPNLEKARKRFENQRANDRDKYKECKKGEKIIRILF